MEKIDTHNLTILIKHEQRHKNKISSLSAQTSFLSTFPWTSSINFSLDFSSRQPWTVDNQPTKMAEADIATYMSDWNVAEREYEARERHMQSCKGCTWCVGAAPAAAADGSV